MPCRLPVDLHTFQGIFYTKGRYFSMKFKEQSKSLNIPVAREPIIYFLLNGDEVVYVGQSITGLCRPYSHSDKQFDNVSIIRCKKEELDDLEIFYIRKYMPKYNKRCIDGSKDFSFLKVKEIIRKNTNFEQCTIFDIKRMMKVIGIKAYAVRDMFYISSDDTEKLVEYTNNHFDGYKLVMN
nr:MAG TPA: UvrABC system protein C [Caudoviricetes sp.]